MLPCYRLCADIGQKNQNAKPGPTIYQNWIKMYADDWFQTSTQEQIDLLDDIAEEASDKEKAKMKEQFVITKEYELAFWEMAYTKEVWLSNRISKG